MRFTIFILSLVVFVSGCDNPETSNPIDASAQRQTSKPAFEILSEMGYLQCRDGDYVKGLQYLQEAADSLKSASMDTIDPEAIIMLYGNLSNLYTRLGLQNEALDVNAQAIAIADKCVVDRLPDLWRMRSMIFNIPHLPDSMIWCINQALESCDRIDDDEFRERCIVINEDAKAWTFIENPHYAPDSIISSIAVLERNLGKYPKHDNCNRLMIGRANVLLGNPAKGIPLMEKSAEAYRKAGETEDLEWAQTLLADSYALTASRKLFDIYRETTALHDTIMLRKQNNTLLGKEFRYRTEELKAENKLLASELSASRQRNLLLITLSAFIITAIVMFFYHRWSQQKRHILQKEQSINSLLADRIALNAKIEELNAELNLKQKDMEHKLVINPKILEKDDEERFRKIFSELYPGFIERLRKDYPGITSGNELLCMLIRLHKSIDETALALGISRESVNTARYRLRSRFNLPKNVNLNDFIQSL